MNRTCGRCGFKDDVENMHWSKTFKSWLCEDRQKCTERLLQKLSSKEGSSESDSPSHRLLRTCCPSQYDRNEETSIYTREKEGSLGSKETPK
jgi:hypothetical protein